MDETPLVDQGPAPGLSVEERLDRLEAQQAVLATLYRYAHALDYGDEVAWVDCFTEDAIYDVRYVDGDSAGYVDPVSGSAANPSHRQRGRLELAAFAARHTRAPEQFHKHLLVEPVIEIGGTTARAASYFLRVDDVDGERVIYAFGRYLDELERSADGRWRFTRRTAEVESRNPQPRPRRAV